jgi:hypothetical protein
METICVFDTETTSLDKPFCYNIGYIIADIDTNTIYQRRDFVVEQVWHNLPLFQSAYYADKRPVYVTRMRARQVAMEKFGLICRQMRYDFRKYGVTKAYAFNSDFDEKVFNFNCDWYKCANPFDNVDIYDIRAFAMNHIANTKEYKDFCESHNLFTESGNYSTTAEAFFKYIADENFVEEHTALADSICEYEILKYLYDNCCSISSHESAPKICKRTVTNKWQVKKGKDVLLEVDASTVSVYKKDYTIRIN